MKDYSIASVFEESRDSTAYRWDDQSEFESEEIDTEEQKLRINVLDLKRVLSEEHIHHMDGVDEEEERDEEIVEEEEEDGGMKPRPLWQSTPQVYQHHHHQMSGSTIGNDFSGKLDSPIATTSNHGTTRLRPVSEEYFDSARESQVETLRASSHQDNPLFAHGRGDHPQPQLDEVEFPESELEEENVEEENEEEGGGDETFPIQHQTPRLVPQKAHSHPVRMKQPDLPSSNKPFFLSDVNMNTLPERLRKEVFGYISTSVSHNHQRNNSSSNPQARSQPQPQPQSQAQTTNQTNPHPQNDSADELAKLKNYLKQSPDGQKQLEGFAKGTPPVMTNPITARSLPNQSLYKRLEMDQVESLNSIELQNLLKNISLQFGIPFSSLPYGVSAIARTLAQEDFCREFACQVHELLYNQEMKYIDRQCLDEMLQHLAER